MKKFKENLVLAFFVIAIGVCACSDTASESINFDDIEVVSLDDLRSETDSTPKDTGTVVR